MQFLTNKEVEAASQENVVTAPQNVKCRFCQGDHWSAHCPNKAYFAEKQNQQLLKEEAAASAGAGGAYKPPSMRAGASQASKTGKPFDPNGKGSYKGGKYIITTLYSQQ
jgi:hypothetical protein